MDDRIYMECTICYWGVSGAQYAVEDKADKHEAENPGHTVERIEDEE